MNRRLCLLTIGALFAVSWTQAADWDRFRGPNGGGVAEEAGRLPVTWSPTENIKWKVALPGPGSSSPIVAGDKLFITCWSGYGMDRNERGGKQEELKRHLICLDRLTGKIVWDKTVAPVLPEDNYGGMFAENGYATHTPVTDGERVYVFFGKTGALAFDLQGNQLWQTSLGTGSDRMNWGSGCSPILYKNLVIVTAAPESQTLYALDKATGKEVWKAQADGFASTWGTPILVDTAGGRTDLVIGVPYEIWAFNPETGKLRWFCEALGSRSVCSSVVTDGKGVVYAMGDQGSGSIAVKAGGEGDVTKSQVLWTTRDTNRIGTPVVAADKLYYVSNRIVGCLETKTGEKIFQSRLTGGAAPAAAPMEEEGERRPGPGGFRGGRGGGGRGGQDYSSPVAADGKLYYVARNGDMFVLKLGDKFEQLAMNRVTTDTEDFSATPAIAGGALFIRSNKHLYCVAE